MKSTKVILTIIILLFSINCFSQHFPELDVLKGESNYIIDNPKKIKVFSGSANPMLAQDIVDQLGLKLSEAIIGRFNDGEIKIEIKENIRGCDVYLIQSTSPGKTRSINDNVMELFFLTRVCKRSGAKSITAIVPYFGYARQDRSLLQEPISAADTAMLLEEAGLNHIVSIDLHCGQIQGFFRNLASDNLSSSSVFSHYISKKNLKNPVIISPDAGGVARAKKFRQCLAEDGITSKMAVIIKERLEPGVVEKMSLVGDVAGSDVIIVDDIIDTGGTLVKAAEELKKNGALNVYACITHPVFSYPAIKRITDSSIDEMVVGDTISIYGKLPSNIKQISFSSLLAKMINKKYTDSCHNTR